MSASILGVLVVAVLLSWFLTWQVCRIALSSGMLDHPNVRSSHTVPTPRGGGLSIVLTTTVGSLCLWKLNAVDSSLMIALSVGGVAVACVGFMDDRGALSVGVRMMVHIAAAIWAMFMLHGLPAMQFGSQLVDLGIYGGILGTMAIIWTLNLFNFMDGIDGIAASEAIFVAGGGAGLTYLVGAPNPVSQFALLLAASCAGFLCWNWPPAKIFMGDVGSGYLGFVVSILAVAQARENPVAIYVWLILSGVFFVDATVTLFRRLARGEKLYEAHRSHAYQWLSRRWGSHLKVTLLVWGINLAWLFPCAWWCIRRPEWAHWITLVALAPLVVCTLSAGAGRREDAV